MTRLYLKSKILNLAKFPFFNFMSLVKSILKQKLVQELIQNQLTEDRLLKELNVIIEGKKRSIMLDHYSKIYSMLSLNNTSHNIANSIIKS